MTGLGSAMTGLGVNLDGTGSWFRIGPCGSIIYPDGLGLSYLGHLCVGVRPPLAAQGPQLHPPLLRHQVGKRRVGSAGGVALTRMYLPSILLCIGITLAGEGLGSVFGSV